MNTSTSTTSTQNTREYYQQKEAAALQQIPGVHELLSAYEKERPALEKKYPDAAFALKISSISIDIPSLKGNSRQVRPSCLKV